MLKHLFLFEVSYLPQRANSITNNTATAGAPSQTVATRWIFFPQPLIFVCLFGRCIIYKTVLHFCTAPLLCKFNTTYFFFSRKKGFFTPCCAPPVCDWTRSTDDLDAGTWGMINTMLNMVATSMYEFEMTGQGVNDDIILGELFLYYTI